MIHALTSENYKNITKVSILDAKDVFYPLKYVLQKRDISFDEDLAIVIKPLPEDIKYPSSSKMTDAGMLKDYKIEITLNNQLFETQERLEMLHNRKVIVVLHHNFGKIIIFKTVGTQEEDWYKSMIQPLLVFPQKEVTKIEDCV